MDGIYNFTYLEQHDQDHKTNDDNYLIIKWDELPQNEKMILLSICWVMFSLYSILMLVTIHHMIFYLRKQSLLIWGYYISIMIASVGLIGTLTSDLFSPYYTFPGIYINENPKYLKLYIATCFVRVGMVGLILCLV